MKHMSNSATIVIPARAGSKGIVGKNKVIVAGRPLIDYTLQVAALTELPVIVSTDDDEIIEWINRNYSGFTIDRRPSHLSMDDSPIATVLEYLVLKYSLEMIPLILLQPTSPFRTVANIFSALKRLEDTDATVVSVFEADYLHPTRVYEADDEYCLTCRFPEGMTTRRQLLSRHVARNGSLYIFYGRTVISLGSIYGKKLIGYEMPRIFSITIDTLSDLEDFSLLLPLYDYSKY